MPDRISSTTSAGHLRVDAAAPATRSQWLGLGLVIAICLLFWAFHTARYAAPNSDFVSYRAASVAMYHGQLPEQLKRPPAWPLILGLAAQCLPGDQPYLWGATAANLMLGATALLLLFCVSRRLTPSLPLLPVMLFCLFPAFHVWVTQPLAEPTMLVMLLAAMLAVARRSAWAYAFAAAASLTRIEFAALIPVLAMIDLIDRPTNWLRTLSLSVTAAAPIVAWTLLGSIGPTDSALGYAAETRGYSVADRTRTLVWMLRPLPDAKFGLDLVGWAGLVLGLFVAVARRSRLGLGVAGFLGVYLLAHTVYPTMRTRYMVPSSWAVLLLTVYGWAWLCEYLVPRLVGTDAHRKPLPTAAACVAVLAALIAVAWSIRSFRQFDGTTWAGPMLYLGLWTGGALAAACYTACSAAGTRLGPHRLTLGGLLLCLLILPSVFAARSVAAQYHKYALEKAQYRAMADWLRHSLPEDTRAATPFRDLMALLVGRDTAGQLVGLGDIGTRDPVQFARMCEEEKIAFVVYVYWPKPDPEASSYALDQLNYDRAGYAVLEPFLEQDRVGRYVLVAEIAAPPGVAQPPGRVFRLLQDPEVSDPASPPPGPAR